MSHHAGPPAGGASAPSPGVPRPRARWRTIDSLTEDDWRRWSELAVSAVGGNAFLTPWFIRAALRHLEPAARLDLLWVERDAAPVGSAACNAPLPAAAPPTGTLAALLVVRPAAPRRSLPFAHLEAWRCVHAYTGGALLARVGARDARAALLAALPTHPEGLGALRLTNLRGEDDCPLQAAHEDSSSAPRWFQTRSGRRAGLRLRATSRPSAAPTTDAQPQDPGPADLSRGRARLQREFGPLRLRVLRGAAVTEAVVERHLALEAAGWKSRAGSALLSSPATAGFFRDCVAGALAHDAVVFCELWAGDTPIASTSNFVCGGVLSAFKLGWEPRAARASPGLLVDQALAAAAAQELPDVHLIDSCADPGSHLERIWTDRVEVVDGYLAWGTAESASLAALNAARRLRNRLQGALRRVTIRRAPRPAGAAFRPRR